MVVCLCMYAYLYACMSSCMYVYVCMYVRMHEFINIFVCKYVCTLNVFYCTVIIHRIRTAAVCLYLSYTTHIISLHQSSIMTPRVARLFDQLSGCHLHRNILQCFSQCFKVLKLVYIARLQDSLLVPFILSIANVIVRWCNNRRLLIVQT
jgi:hypothetical protein